MNKQIKKFRRLIQRTMPYRFHDILLRISFAIFLIMIIAVIVMNFIKVKPIAFDENNTFTYTYIDVNQVRNLVDEYYVADDGRYVYLYYSNESSIPTSTNKIVGVPRLIDEKVLEKLIPSFQSLYPDLNVKTIEDMIKYTGNYYFDYTAAPLLYDMQIAFIFSVIPFICWLIILMIKNYYKKRYNYSLKNIIKKREVTTFIDQFKNPLVIFKSINTCILYDYLVINHPSPYVIYIDDIVWIYVEKKKFFLLFDQELALVIYDQNLKKTRVLAATAFSNNNKKELSEVLTFVSRVNSRALIGYSQHNEKIYKQLKKD